MSKIGQAIIGRLEDGEDIETIIEKGLQNERVQKTQG